MNKKFWADRKVLITGFEGFLGSNLTRAVLKTGAKVVGIDIKTFRKDTILCPADYKKMVVRKASVTDYRLIKGILNRHSINVIFHLAAEAIVGRSHENPRKAFHTNIAGTWNILEAARWQKSVETIIVSSSDKAYGSHKKLPYAEETPLKGGHPYDVSKSCADLIANTYFHTYGLPVAVTRCGNIYGPGDFNFSRLTPDAMRSLVLNKTLKIRSDGNFIRDYVYIDDVVEGYFMIAELFRRHKLSGEAFNLSGGKPVAVIKLLEKINRLNFRENKLKYKIMNTAKYEIKEQYLSSAKARRVLGWRPRHGLEEGLRKTAEWYAEYLNK